MPQILSHQKATQISKTYAIGKQRRKKKGLPVCGTCSPQAPMEPPFVTAWHPPIAVIGPQSRRRAGHEMRRCASPLRSRRGEALQTELLSRSRTSRQVKTKHEPIKLLSFSRATYPRNVPFSTTGNPWYSQVSANLSVLRFVSGKTHCPQQ